MNIAKIAAKDAAEWARAEMFFGEGAGTRRKLLGAAIAHKVENVSGYQEAFAKAYSMQDMAEHAIKAAKERQHIDRAAVVGKNAKALLRGDRRGLSTGVLVVVTILVVANQTGYDKVAIEYGKKKYTEARLWVYRTKLKYDAEKRLRKETNES